MTINEFAAEVHKNAVEHGWWEGERTFPEIVALIHSEVFTCPICIVVLHVFQDLSGNFSLLLFLPVI